jgi:CRP/FNR family transcriptional regulator
MASLAPGTVRRRSTDGNCAHCAYRGRCWREPTQPELAIRAVRESTVPRGSALHFTRPQRDSVWLVRSGALKVIALTRSGEESVVDFRLAGDLLLDWDSPGPQTVLRSVALTDVTLCRLAPPGDPDAAVAFWRRVMRLTRLSLARSFDPWLAQPAVERVRHFLEDMAQRLPRSADGMTFELPMTRGDIGSRLGLTEESVCRALRTLHRSGRYRVAHRHVTVHGRRRGLRAAASES